MDNPTDSLFKLAYIFQTPHDRRRKLACPLGNLKQALNNLSYHAGLDYSKEKVGLKMPEEPWEITHLALRFIGAMTACLSSTRGSPNQKCSP
jgi:hypothetical protein